MKKVLAIFLAVICAFSAFSVSVFAGAEDILGEVIGGILGEDLGAAEEDSALDAITYGIIYEMSTGSNVTLVYKPTHTLTLSAPAIAKVTSDTPIAVDHNWVCWKDKETGTLYYPGDEIEVNGQVFLVAVWEEKTDSYPSFIRSLIAGVQALLRMVENALGIFQAVNDTKDVETTTEPTTLAA